MAKWTEAISSFASSLQLVAAEQLPQLLPSTTFTTTSTTNVTEAGTGEHGARGSGWEVLAVFFVCFKGNQRKTAPFGRVLFLETNSREQLTK